MWKKKDIVSYIYLYYTLPAFYYYNFLFRTLSNLFFVAEDSCLASLSLFPLFAVLHLSPSCCLLFLSTAN